MRQRPLRLRTRIALWFTGLVLLWTAAVLVALGSVLSGSAHEFYREAGAQVACALAAELVPLAYHEDYAAIRRVLARVPETHPQVRYVVVLDGTGAPMETTLPGGAPRSLLAVPRPPPDARGVSARLVRAEGRLLYDYEVRRAGLRVRAGLGLEAVQESVQGTMTLILWTGIGGLLAVLAMALRVSRPVERLTSAIDRAVLLAHATGVAPAFPGTLETEVIADRFQDLVGKLEEKTRQLDVSRKLAYLGELSAAIAHEVNNPLGVIVINAEFLAARSRKGTLPREAAEEAERLYAAARRATLAVQKLLQFARYSTGGARPAHRPAEIRPLVTETVSLIEDRIRESGVRVTLDVPDALPRVPCDAQGLQQVLFNLLTNALDASSPGGEISVRARSEGAWLVLEVADGGGGMTPEVLRRAKEPFFTTKEPGRGTGLGLAISDSIARQHSGELTLQNRAGGGVSAVVRIPTGAP